MELIVTCLQPLTPFRCHRELRFRCCVVPRSVSDYICARHKNSRWISVSNGKGTYLLRNFAKTCVVILFTEAIILKSQLKHHNKCSALNWEIPELPAEYQINANNGQFLTFDKGIGNQERIFIFPSEVGFRFLAKFEHWHANETFIIYPEISFQLYTVHAPKQGSVFTYHLENGSNVYESL